jgi:DNA-binding MarR family transcriptional regulator
MGARVGPRPDPDDLVDSLRALGLALERWRGVFARRHGLADNDAVVLSHLASAQGRLLPRDLSRAMNVRTGTLTAMLDRLEHARFVRRVPNPDDRRSTFVEVTERGSNVIAESLTVLQRNVASGIPVGTHAKLARYLVDLTAIVDGVIEELDTQVKPRRAPRARPRSN